MNHYTLVHILPLGQCTPDTNVTFASDVNFASSVEIEPNNSMAYISKTGPTIYLKTQASREMTSRKKNNIFCFNGVNVDKHWHVAGEVFAISDCVVSYLYTCRLPHNILSLKLISFSFSHFSLLYLLCLFVL